ncbi:Lrp/AsnC ligand binding domain-containing protein [Streptomyces lasalocidi]
MRPSQLTAVASAIADHPEVPLVAHTTGTTNLLAAVNCRDSLDLARYLTARIASLDASSRGVLPAGPADVDVLAHEIVWYRDARSQK